MDRIYMNHRDGERRIHVEIEEEEIAELLASPESAAGQRLNEILGDAHRRFQGAPS